MIFHYKLVLSAIASGCVLTTLFPLATQADHHIVCTPDGCITRLCEPTACYRDTERKPLTIISPIAGSLRTTRPTIRWFPIESVTGYKVEILDSDREIKFDKDVDADTTELTLTPSEELPRDQIYTLRITPIHLSQQELVVFRREFNVISEEQLQYLDNITQGSADFEQIIALYRNPSEEESIIINSSEEEYVVDLPQNSEIIQPLYTDAVELLQAALENDPDNLRYILLLGQTYKEAGFPELAEEQYQHLYHESSETNEYAMLAQSQVGLAKVTLTKIDPANQDPEENQALFNSAIDQLQQALDNFKVAGDDFFIAQTLQFIAETYRENNDPERAQQFYSQTLVAYQDVELKEWLSEEELENFVEAIRWELEKLN